MENQTTFLDELTAKYPSMMDRIIGGIETSPGWFHIIRALMFQINSHVTHSRKWRARQLRAMMVEPGYGRPSEYLNAPPYVSKVKVIQIKEKFGSLRFYVDGGDDYVMGLITMAEEWSVVTCEVCGNKGFQRQGGWIRTLCDEHC